jgi:hypothetical protein
MASDLRMTAGRGPRDCNLKQYLHCRPYPRVRACHPGPALSAARLVVAPQRNRDNGTPVAPSAVPRNRCGSARQAHLVFGSPTTTSLATNDEVEPHVHRTGREDDVTPAEAEGFCPCGDR